jgi:hypothetical protein
MFIASTPNERNDYGAAIRAALAALKTDATLDHYQIAPADLKRASAYNQGGAYNGLKKQLAALQSPHTVAKGTDSDTGEKVVAILFTK